MCGIWAVFGFRCGRDVSYLNTFNLVAHRGPDASRLENVADFPDCWLGFHHLSIVQDFYSMQPMRIKPYPHLRLLYNGEIYNHKSLGHAHSFDFLTACDGEVMLHLYEKCGAQSLAEQLNGVFAFVIIDTKRRQVHLGRDQYGVRPLFTLRDEQRGALAVCSEVKGIIAMKKECSQDCHVTPFRPGSVTSFSVAEDGKVNLIKTGRYTWAGKAPVFRPGVELDSLQGVKENIRIYLKESVRVRLMSDRRMGCLLSGGLDSSLVTALMVRCAKEAGIKYPIQTFAVGFPGGSDVEAARSVAKHLGTEHHEIIIENDEHFDVIPDVIYALEAYDVNTIRSATCMWLMARYIRSNTDSVVIFSGEGSDELTQGYLYLHKQPSPEEGDRESRELLENIYLLAGLRADRIIAAHGLELRVPFLDSAFSWYYLSIDAKLRCPRDGIEKFLLRSAFDGEGLIPEEILWRQKLQFSKGVTAEDDGIVEIMARRCESAVTDEELAAAGQAYPINTPQTKEGLYYRKIFEEHFPGQTNLTPSLWNPKW